MAYWLFKSEPGTWSWEDQMNKGIEGEGWDGVRNYQANNNMKKMKVGDLGFFYHSVKEKQIVGIVRVIGEHRPDPTDKKKIFDNLGIYFPRDNEMGVHINISGAGLLQNAPNNKNGKKLINFLLSDKAQKIYSFNKYISSKFNTCIQSSCRLSWDIILLTPYLSSNL